MDNFQRIYTTCAAEYQRMIAPEDVDGNLLAAIRRVTPVRGLRVLDLGTGTGRLPLLLAPEAAQVVGLDLHEAMLRESAAQRALLADPQITDHWHLVQGDMRWLPFPDRCAGLVTAGWAIGHLRAWFADDWKAHIGQVLREMRRVVVSGGTLIVVETLTTGSLTPAPPTEALAEYYAWLEADWGFSRQVIQTDYVFTSAEEAAARTEFFFGEALAQEIRARSWARLPEWTGVWSRSTR